MTGIIKHEYNGHLIPQRVKGDYVDVTALCQSEGKELAAYLRLQKTKKYLEYLTSDMQIDMSELVQIDKGDGGHTFAHPEIAMDVSVWVSIPCRTWANRTLVNVVKQSANPKVTQLPSRSISEIDEFATVVGKRFGPHVEESCLIINLRRHYPDMALPEIAAEDRTSLPSQKALMTPTEIGEELGIVYKTGRGNGAKVNVLLKDLGYQVKTAGSPPWSPTEKGEPFCDLKPVDTGSKSDKFQLLWRVSIIDELRNQGMEAAA